jgi:DNA-binding NarL/FixJ family response regulator
MIRLMLADDHTIVREGLRQLFALLPEFQVVAEAADGAGVLERLHDCQIDVLLVDMNMPGLSGESLIARIRTHHPTLPILVLSMYNEPQIAQTAIKAGANGYITKDQDTNAIIGAIRRVASGGRFLAPQLAEQLAFLATRGVLGSHASLSEREFQILRMIARGLSINDIADTLTISSKTVSTHKSRLMEKMGFSSTADLVRYAVEHRLAD